MKRIIAVLLSLCQISWGAVLWRANSAIAEDSGIAAASPQTSANTTVGTGPNRVLVLQIGWDAAAASMGTITVNWDSTGTNQPMTLIKSLDATDASGSCQLWGLVAPTSGTHTLRIAWTTGTHEVIYQASDFTGANQGGGNYTFVNSTSASGTSTTEGVIINNVVGGITIDCSNVANSAPGTAPTQTQIMSASGSGSNNPASSRSTIGTQSNIHHWTISSFPWESVGTAIAPVAPCQSILGSNIVCGQGTQ